MLVSLCVCLGIRGFGDSTEVPLQIKAIYPTGEEVDSDARISIEFNQSMVDLSPSVYAEEVVPVEIEPAIDCDWIWVKSNLLKCELQNDKHLHEATEFRVTVLPGISSLLGQELEERYVHSFKTVLPAITDTDLVSWMSPTQPIFEISFNQAVNIDSLRGRIFLHDRISGSRVSARIWPSDESLTYELWLDFFGRAQTHKNYDYLDTSSANDSPTKNFIVLPIEPLPPEVNVSLILQPGIEGAHGNLGTVKRTFVTTDVRTVGEFHMLGLICQDLQGEDVFLTNDMSLERACDKSSNFALVFSSMMDGLAVESFRTDPPSSHADDASWSRTFGREYVNDVPEIEGFKYWFQRDLKPNRTYRLYIAPTTDSSDTSDSRLSVRDGFGQPLMSSAEISFRTTHDPPELFVEQRYIVVDANGSNDPLLHAHNVDDVTITYTILDEIGELKNQTRSLSSPTSDDSFLSQVLGLRSALRSPSGVMTGTVSGHSRFDLEDDPIRESFVAQATPYSVFVKVRDFRVLVWVVDLQTGEPISNAEVRLFSGVPIDYSETLESIFSSATDKDGLVTFQVQERIDPTTWYEKQYFVHVKGDEGIAMLPLLDRFQFQDLYFPDPTDVEREHWIAPLQLLYKPGDTVHIKGYIRDVSTMKREIPDGEKFAICIENSRIRAHKEITLNQFGAFHVSYELNGSDQFGIYRLWLVSSETHLVEDSCSYLSREKNYGTPEVNVSYAGFFEVYEFETSPIQVSLELNSETFHRGDQVSIFTTSKFFDGKPNANGIGNMEVLLIGGPPPIQTVDIKEFEFSGIQFAPMDTEWYDIQTDFDIHLDDEGEHTQTLDISYPDVYYGTFRIESWVGSNLGSTVTSRIMAEYYGVDQFVGIRHPVATPKIRYFDWSSGKVSVDRPWPVEVLVVSKEDEIVTGKDVQITVYTRGQNLAFSQYEWKQVFNCEVVSGLDPVSCDFTPTEIGIYRIDAQIVDTKGHTHQSSVLVEAVPLAEWVSAGSEQSRLGELDLSCDIRAVKVGDTVRCFVRNSLTSAVTLVTIEQTGVVDQWVVRLDSKDPYIEFNIREEYAPNFTLSVLSQSSSVTKNDNQATLARNGTTKFTVEDPIYPPLEIAVATDRELYDAGDRVTLSISTKQARGVRVPIEYAVVVIDETLLNFVQVLENENKFVDYPTLHALLPAEREANNQLFDPTSKRWHSVRSGVHTYGLITALKTQSVTLDGVTASRNRPSIRISGNTISNKYLQIRWSPADMLDPRVHEIKNWVAYWNPSAITSNGRKKLSFELPDYRPRWKVMVAAVSADHRFGFGTTSFETQKDIDVRAFYPNVVTAGDVFQVGVVIQNRTKHERSLPVDLRASGVLAADSETRFRQRTNLAAFETKTLTLNVKTDSGSARFKRTNDTNEIRVVARVGDRKNRSIQEKRIPVRNDGDQTINRYSGFEIHREYLVLRENRWIILESGDHINKGETVLVNLFLNNKLDRHHVLLEDSVPGGLIPVSFEEFGWHRESLFQSTSAFEDILPSSQWYEEFKDDVERGWVGEIGLQKVRFLDDSLPRDKYHAAWIGRAITSGKFSVPPAQVKEVYRPVMLSKSKPWILKVEP